MGRASGLAGRPSGVDSGVCCASLPPGAGGAVALVVAAAAVAAMAAGRLGSGMDAGRPGVLSLSECRLVAHFCFKLWRRDILFLPNGIHVCPECDFCQALSPARVIMVAGACGRCCRGVRPVGFLYNVGAASPLALSWPLLWPRSLAMRPVLPGRSASLAASWCSPCNALKVRLLRYRATTAAQCEICLPRVPFLPPRRHACPAVSRRQRRVS